MRRFMVAALTTVMALGMLAGPAVAQELPEHGHVLLLHADTEPNPEYPAEGPPYILLGFERCVELAGGQALGLGAQHERVHFGKAGEALSTKAGHLIVPLAPFPGVPFEGCADLEAAFPNG